MVNRSLDDGASYITNSDVQPCSSPKSNGPSTKFQRQRFDVNLMCISRYRYAKILRDVTTNRQRFKKIETTPTLVKFSPTI